MTSTHTPIALITGASRGLGKSMALHLARAGTDVVFTYRSAQAEAQAVQAEIQALGRQAVALPLEVGRAAGFDAFTGALKAALAQHWQRDRFDYLVNNAGMGVYAPFSQVTEAQFDELVNVNTKGLPASK